MLSVLPCPPQEYQEIPWKQIVSFLNKILKYMYLKAIS